MHKGGWVYIMTNRRNGTLMRGMAMLSVARSSARRRSWAFITPMWAMAVGIMFTGAVTANGALEKFGDIAGTAVALHFCIQSLIVGIAGTLAVIGFKGDAA